mgnify:CR=1 FL=1|tara:strand:+ start:294 stop:674 length:381 start_codon:yes stop_codon:yes gene_type:complete
MKKDYKTLNKILKFYVESDSGVGISPETVSEKLELNIEKKELFLMCNLMFDDGYLYLPSENLIRYSANYKAKLFLDEGGYVTQKRISDRKKKASCMVENLEFLKYPVGIIISLFVLYKFLKEFNLL